MVSSAERDYATEWSSGEGDSSRSPDVLTGASPRGANALHDRRRAETADSPGDVPDMARQRNDHLPPGFAAWKLGQDLVDRREYERAAECFRGVLLSAETPVASLSAE